MSRAVIMESFGGPEKLELQDVDEPHASPGQIRVHVSEAGLNPMDWIITANERVAARFGVTLPCGFGTDFAGVVDEVGDGISAFKVGDRVFGSALSRSVADYVVVDPSGATFGDDVHHTPKGLDDKIAATLDIAASTAAAALDAIKLGEGDTVLIGGAAGGVGVFAIQLARLAGAKVIGTASEAAFDYLRSLGAAPVTYGEGLAERVLLLAPEGITAATDLYGTETVDVARKLGVPDSRISIIAAQVPGISSVGGANAAPGTLERVAELVTTGKVEVPIAATYRVEQIRAAVEFQSTRHVHGKIVVSLTSASNHFSSTLEPPGAIKPK